MSKIELIEIINPPANAMVRSFHCVICDKQHLQNGEIARVWVLAAGGYSTNASLECFNAVAGGMNLPQGNTTK